MHPLVFTAVCTLFAVAPAHAQTGAALDPHAAHAMEQQAPPAASGQTTAATPRNDKLPPDADASAAQLKSSARHAEWVDVKNGEGTPIKSFVVYPERKDKAPVVIVIHEIFGLTDWVRGVADQLAKEGFIAVAPDFLSGKGPNSGGSQELGPQGSTQVIRNVTPEDTVRILDAVRSYALTIPSANGKVATIGFCWGGGTSFRYALNQPALNAAVSYYGPMPTDAAAYEKAKAPILGLYGGNDNRVNSTIDPAKAELAKKNVTYEPHIFEGAGHGFLRQQAASEQAPGNPKATQEAWPLTLDFLRKHTK
jgi:carboxymethylenebutenolidase